jgi:hypothetical protein
MCCEHLICARCTGPVAQARCHSCRAARADLHGPRLAAGPQAIVLLTVLALILLAMVVRSQLG